MKTTMITSGLTLVLALPLGVMANDPMVSMGRYTRVSATASPAQADVLSALTTIRFSAHVKTVGDAINSLLAGSGFSLARTEVDAVLLDRPLPVVHRELGPLPMITALQTLAGSSWVVVPDTLTRQVEFRLSDATRDRRRELVARVAEPIIPEKQYTGDYALQVGAYKTLDHAERFAEQLVEHQLETQVRKSGLYYRVYTHLGQEKTALMALKPELDQLLGIQSLVRLTPVMIRELAQKNQRDRQASIARRRAMAGVSTDHCGQVDIRVGSLKDNIARNIESCGFRMGLWRLGEGEFIDDWVVQNPYQVDLETGSGVKALVDFIDRNYQIRGTINQIDQTIDFERSGRNLAVSP